MPDGVGAEDLVVADEARQYGETGGVGARPGVGPAQVAVEGKDRARPGLPATAVPERLIELEQDPVVIVDEQHVAVAVVAPAGLPSLDPLRLGARSDRDRVAGGATGSAHVALVGIAVGVEVHDLERRRAGDDGVDHAVDVGERGDVPPEVGVDGPARPPMPYR